MKMKAAVLTVSDRASKGIYEDESGKVLMRLIEDYGLQVLDYKVVEDDREKIKKALETFCDQGINLIITSGGTGFSERDVTPEATLDILDKLTPGIDQAMRAEGAKNTPMAYLSRGISGIRDQSLIINFPGSPKACRENFDAISGFLKHGLEIISGRANH